jgi:hypothetical protein
MEKEWQAWTDELAEKSVELRELDRWIESLKNKGKDPESCL